MAVKKIKPFSENFVFMAMTKSKKTLSSCMAIQHCTLLTFLFLFGNPANMPASTPSFSHKTMAAPAQDGRTYSYKIKIATVDNIYTFKEIFGELEAIFDIRPQFNDATDEITIVSAYDVPNDRLSMKLTALGYTLVAYQQFTDYKSPK